jgi:glycine dehydrogenase subunit 1
MTPSKTPTTSSADSQNTAGVPDEDNTFATRDERNYPYLSLTEPERETLRDVLGIESFDELETDVPEELRREFTPQTEPSTEEAVMEWHKRVSGQNQDLDDLTCFLGGGLYDHHVPSTVLHLMNRAEFLTSYTPYQAEINQGTLQGMFEFQSMICELTQLPVTNASMYDGATAFAEAVLMAVNTTNRDTIYYSPNLYDAWIGVLETYAHPHGWSLKELPTQNGRARYPDTWEEDVAAVCLGYPNQYGLADPVSEWEQNRPDNKAVGIAGINPLSLGLLTPPGDLGMDVCVGEGQPLGLPLSGGAPQLGLLSARERFTRRMPGRLVGETEDRRGNRCYVLTLQTREQHIRRERATSNICTNHALLTLGISVALATLGPDGLRQRSLQNYQRGQTLADAFENEGLNVLGDPIFNEVTVELPDETVQPNAQLKERGWMGGYRVNDRYVCAATERRTESEIEEFASEVARTLG